LLFDTYKPLPGTFDEMIDVDGMPRSHTRRATRILDGLSPKEFAQAQSLAHVEIVTPPARNWQRNVYSCG